MEEWGQYLSVDLGECDPEQIRSNESIVSFIENLIKEIGMKQYGKVLTERFALHDTKVAGYSAMCFLETSSITAHFAEESNSVYIDIFTCSVIDVEKTVRFCIDFFDAKFERHSFNTRYIPNKFNSNQIKIH